LISNPSIAIDHHGIHSNAIGFAQIGSIF